MTTPSFEWLEERFTCAQGTTFPVRVARVQGRRPGAAPPVCFIAGQHGGEPTGVHVLRRLLAELAPAELCGTLYVCPAANPKALELDYEIYPEREDLTKLGGYFYSRARHGYCVFGLSRGGGGQQGLYNLNRLWPGRKDAGVAGRIAAWLWKTAVAPARVVVDLHSCGREVPHLLVAYEGCELALPLARHLGPRWVTTPDHPASYNRGNLRYQSNQEPRVNLTVEFSRHHEIAPAEILFGLRGLRNLLKALGNLPGAPEDLGPLWRAGAKRHTLRAGARGHVQFHVGHYEPVEKGQPLCALYEIATSELLEEHRAPAAGVTGGLAWRPVIQPGDELLWVNEAMRLDGPAQRPPYPGWEPEH